MADPNPKPHPGIISLIINVKCEDYHFDVQAWDHETQEGYTCNGGADDDSKALLNEILGKIPGRVSASDKALHPRQDGHRPLRECAPAPAAAVPFGIPMAGVAAAIVVPDRFENTVVFASVDSDRESKTPPIYAFDVDFKKPMPNGSGTMEITIKNRVYKFPLQIYHGPRYRRDSRARGRAGRSGQANKTVQARLGPVGKRNPRRHKKKVPGCGGQSTGDHHAWRLQTDRSQHGLTRQNRGKRSGDNRDTCRQAIDTWTKYVRRDHAHE